MGSFAELRLCLQEYVNAIAMRLVTATNKFNGSSEQRLEVGIPLCAPDTAVASALQLPLTRAPASCHTLTALYGSPLDGFSNILVCSVLRVQGK